MRAALGCGLLVVLSPAGVRLEGDPKPPSAAQIKAAENRVRQQQAALGAAQGKLSAATRELTKLQDQAEGKRNKLAGQLNSAEARASDLKAARQAALTARAAAAAAAAERATIAAGGSIAGGGIAGGGVAGAVLLGAVPPGKGRAARPRHRPGRGAPARRRPRATSRPTGR